MKKRLVFQCGKCKRNFSFQPEIGAEQELFFTCPYCDAELLLKLEPFRSQKISTLRDVNAQPETPAEAEWDYQFPDLIFPQLRER